MPMLSVRIRPPERVQKSGLDLVPIFHLWTLCSHVMDNWARGLSGSLNAITRSYNYLLVQRLSISQFHMVAMPGSRCLCRQFESDPRASPKIWIICCPNLHLWTLCSYVMDTWARGLSGSLNAIRSSYNYLLGQWLSIPQFHIMSIPHSLNHLVE